MSALTHIASSTLDKAIFGGDLERSLNDMTNEELTARFYMMREREKVLYRCGFVGGLGASLFAGFKIIALAAL